MSSPSISERIRQLAPHWGVMFVLMLGLILAAEVVVGTLAFWQSFLFVLLVAFGYPPLVRRLGVAPEVWQ